MEPINSRDSEAVGWHLIARGGDMTARVHAGMRLGVLTSGDLSFEAPDAVVQLDLAGEGLILSAMGDDYELELEAGERLQTLRVGAQTHIRLDFLGHTLDIDNDFAATRPPGDALALYVVRKGAPRRPLGPLSAPARDGEMPIGERSPAMPLAAVPLDYLQREHAAAAAEKRQAAEKRTGIRRAILVLVGSVLVVASLVTTALYVASLSVEEAITNGETDQAVAVPSVAGSGDVSVSDPAAASASAPASESSEAVVSRDSMGSPTPVAAEPAGSATMAVSQDMFLRLTALVEADPLPDKASIDFAVASLRSLMVAYPDDSRIPDALAVLNERLVQEARQSYDQGDAFRAGRLIEQATTLGLAATSVADTLAYFSATPPGMATRAADAGSTDPAPAESEEEEMGVAAAVQAAEQARGAGADAGLDSLVESATGLALGALAVEVIVEDSGPGAAESDPLLATLGPVVPLEPASNPVETTVQQALDTYLAESAARASAVSANDLPDGFPADALTPGADDPGAEALSGTEAPMTAASDPRFLPYSELEPVRVSPLVYPSGALEGAEGSIDVAFTVSESGRVIDVNVSGDAPGIFLRNAARTIRTWRFAPVLDNGAAVPVRTALRVTYRG